MLELMKQIHNIAHMNYLYRNSSGHRNTEILRESQRRQRTYLYAVDVERRIGDIDIEQWIDDGREDFSDSENSKSATLNSELTTLR